MAARPPGRSVRCPGCGCTQAVPSDLPADRRNTPRNRGTNRLRWLWVAGAVAILPLTGLAYRAGVVSRPAGTPAVPTDRATARPARVPEESPGAVPSREAATGGPRAGQQAVTAAPHPSPRKLGEAEFWDLARTHCPPGTARHSIGMLAAFKAAVWVEFALLLGDRQTTEAEFGALVHWCVHRQFAPGGWAAGLPFGDDYRAADAEAEAAARGVVADILELYALTRDRATGDPGAFRRQRAELIAAASDPATIRARKYPAPAEQVLAELDRYRRSGPLAHNLPGQLAPPEKPGSAPAGFKVGDRVKNRSVLVIWTGTVVGVEGEVYRVRIDYAADVPGSRGLEVRKTYDFLARDLAPYTNPSVDSFLRGR